MNIEIYCVGLCENSGKISQTGGCGIVLLSVDNYGRIQRREFSFGLGGSSKILSGIQACRLALASVLPSFRNNRVSLFLDDSEVADLITSNVTMVGYKHQIAELHRWRGYYNNLTVNVVAGKHQQLDKAKELAKLGLTSQKNSDSLTIRVV